MYRGFNCYFREGLKSSAKTVYRNKCFFRYILYFFTEFLGRMIIIFNPHFNLADMRQGYVIRKANRLDFSSSFRRSGASVWTYVLALCYEALILIAGVVALSLLAAVLGAVGYGVSKIAAYDNYEVLILMFAAPCALLAVLYVLITLLIFSPTAYIIAHNEKVSAGEAIGVCYRSMLCSGKSTVFFTYFITLLIKSLYLGIMGAGGYFILTLLIPQNYYTVTLIAWAILSLSGYVLFAPVLTLTNRVVKEHLFEDTVLDSAAARVSEKVNLSACEGKKVKPETLSQNLACLFEYTEDPYRILGETEKKAPLLETYEKQDNKKARAATRKLMAEPQPAVNPAGRQIG